MKGIVLGGIFAAALVGAFVLGMNHDSMDFEESPGEKIGKTIDEGINDASRALKDATD